MNRSYGSEHALYIYTKSRASTGVYGDLNNEWDGTICSFGRAFFFANTDKAKDYQYCQIESTRY